MVYFNYIEVVLASEQPGFVTGLAEYLKEDGRPLFVEDLPQEYQFCFEELEMFPYPRQVLTKEGYLLLELYNEDDDIYLTQDQLLASLSEMMLTTAALFTIEPQEEWEEPESQARFFVLEEFQLKPLSAKEVKQRTGKTLLKSYKNSKEILWSLVGVNK